MGDISSLQPLPCVQCPLVECPSSVPPDMFTAQPHSCLKLIIPSIVDCRTESRDVQLGLLLSEQLPLEEIEILAASNCPLASSCVRVPSVGGTTGHKVSHVPPRMAHADSVGDPLIHTSSLPKLSHFAGWPACSGITQNFF